MPILRVVNTDLCLPDYFPGDARPWVCIPVWRAMSFKDVRDAIHRELREGAIGGADDRTRDDSGPIGDAWLKAAHAAVNRDIKPAKRGARRPYAKALGADASDECMAYFVFIDVDSLSEVV